MHSYLVLLIKESISDLIGEEGDVVTEASHEAGQGARVWRLNNKYYSARVQVQPAGEHFAPGAAQRAQAHVVLLQPHEASAPFVTRDTKRGDR